MKHCRANRNEFLVRGLLVCLVGIGMTPVIPAMAGSQDRIPDYATRLTELDTNGDGTVDLRRRFDSAGRVRWMNQRMDGDGSASGWVRDFARSEDGTLEVWVFEEAGTPRSRTEVKKTRGGLFLERVTLESDPAATGNDPGWVRRIWEGRRGLELEQTVEERDSQGWRKVAGSTRRIRPLFALSNEFLQKYPACGSELDALGEFEENEKECERMAAADAIDFQDFVSNSSCVEGGRHLWLESGYRVDLSSCAADSAVMLLEDVTREVRENSLSCLRQVNPAFGSLVEGMIQVRAPVLHCVNASNPLNIDSEEIDDWCWGSTDFEKCVALLRDVFAPDAHALASDNLLGFVRADLIDDAIFLIGQDPVVGVSPSEMYQDFIPGLQETIFHETLHLAGHGGSNVHNEGGLRAQGDDVFGCAQMCGGDSDESMVLSSESCEACVRGWSDGEINPFNTSSASPARGQDRSYAGKPIAVDCRQLPSAEQIKVIDEKAFFTLKVARECEASGPDKCSRRLRYLHAELAERCKPAELEPDLANLCKQLRAPLEVYVSCENETSEGGRTDGESRTEACLGRFRKRVIDDLNPLLPPGLQGNRLGYRLKVINGRLEFSDWKPRP